MHLYLRILLLWIALSAVPYIISRIQHYKSSSNMYWKYWKYDSRSYILSASIFYGGVVGISVIGFAFFLIWFFPELKNLPIPE